MTAARTTAVTAAHVRTRHRDPSLGRAGRADDRGLSRADRPPVRPFALLPEEACRGRLRRAAAVGGLDAIAALPFTEKDELRATRSEAEPIGTHLAVPMTSVARIYSTSGTTGTPSYVPLTADDLADWATISARSYAASGVSRGDRLISTYNVGPFVAGATIDAFAKLGLTVIPVGSGNTDRLMAAVQCSRPTPSPSPPPMRSTSPNGPSERGIDPAGIERAPAAGGRRARRRRAGHARPP